MGQSRGHFCATLYTARTGFTAAEQQRPKKSKPRVAKLGAWGILVAAAKALRYFFIAAALSAYFFVKRSTRPAVSTSFCLPVKNGWQFEQISTRICWPLNVERVSNVLPQAQCTFTAW